MQYCVTWETCSYSGVKLLLQVWSVFEGGEVGIAHWLLTDDGLGYKF